MALSFIGYVETTLSPLTMPLNELAANRFLLFLILMSVTEVFLQVLTL